jgi:hypothetical protein
VLGAVVIAFLRALGRDRAGFQGLASERARELTTAKTESQLLRDLLEEERAHRHQAVNALTAEHLRVELAIRFAASCTCGAMAPYLTVVLKEPPS